LIRHALFHWRFRLFLIRLSRSLIAIMFFMDRQYH